MEQCRVTKKLSFFEKIRKSRHSATKNSRGIPDPVVTAIDTVRIERVLSGHRLPVARTLPPGVNAPQAGGEQRFVRPTLSAYFDWRFAPDLLPEILES